MASGDVIGAAVVEVTADASGVSAGIAQATQQVKQFAQTAQQAGQQAGQGLAKGSDQATMAAIRLAREQDKLTAQIDRYAQSVGRSRGEVLEARAQALGLGQALQQQLGHIRATEAALKTQTATLSQYGLTAKQQAAALRGVPAQITDIFVGLQGGQNPLTVLLQQGGQLKDMFGGLVPAARALGAGLAALITPFTVLTGLAAALAVAFVKGQGEAEKYAAAIITTGNAAGVTANQLGGMAARIDGVIGTQAAAAQALVALTQTGVVGARDLEQFATVAIRLQKTLGTSVEDTARQFADLAKDPLKASQRLNESMNYLTLDVYRQIAALQEQGREVEAGAVAQRAYADAMEQRTAQLSQNLGTVERLWNGIKGAAAEAWDAMLNVGRAQSLDQAIEQVTANVERLRGLTGNNIVGGGGAARASAARRAQAELAEEESRLRNLERGRASQNRFASEQGARAQREKEAIAAQERLNALEKATLSNAQKRAQEIAKMKRDAELTGLSLEKQNELEKAINEKYKDRAGRKPAAVQDDEATRYLLRLREINAALTAQTLTDEKLTEAERERARFIQQIADLKEKKVLTADQKSLLANEQSIRAQLDLNVAVNAEVETRKEAARALEEQRKALERYANGIEGLQITMAGAAEGRADQRTRQLGAFGRGDRAREELEAQRQLTREYEKYEQQVIKAAARNNVSVESEQVQRDLAAVRSARDRELEAQADYYRQLDALRSNWLNGATRALENYYESTRDIAGQIGEVFENAFKGAEDALTKFITTGKLDLKSFGEAIHEDITRALVRTQITGPLSQALSGQMQSGEGIGGWLAGLFGNLFGGGAQENGGWTGVPTPLSGGAAGAGLASVATGATAATGALVALTQAASAASVSMGGQAAASGGGGFWGQALSWVGSLFGRANGGSVGPWSAHQVGEMGPEVLTVGNRQVLLTGAQGGQVTPMRGGNTINSNIYFTVQGPVDRRSEATIGRQVSRKLQSAVQRWG